MANARIVHLDLDGSTNQFDVTFPYINKTHVIVRVDGVATTGFTWVTSSRIQITSMPASGSNVVITRETSPTTRLVDYQTGSILSETILDTDSLQAFYLGQEAQDVKDYTLSKSEATNLWDATSLRLTNLANPTAAQDGVTKYYLENTWLSPANKTALTTVNANISNINSVNSNETNINTLSARNADLITLGALGTEIGNLGTADAVSDMNTLAVSDVIADMNLLATADIISDMNTLATADIVADMNQLAVTDVINDMNTLATTSNVNNLSTVAGAITNVNTTATNISNVNTTAGSISNVNTTAGAITNVNNVGNNISSVNTAATNIAAINTVASDLDEGTSEIDTVATNITNVNAVGNSISNVNTAATNISAINTVATDLNEGTSEIDTVATNITNVNNVGNSITNVNTVAGQTTEIGRLGTADAVADMNTLGTTAVVEDLNILGTADVVSDLNTLGTTANVSNMSTLAPISGNITTVAGISSDVTTVAGKATEIGRLGTADAVSDMNTLGTSATVTAMDTVAGSITNVNTTATNIASVNTTAANISGVNSFADRYRVAASAPTSSLDEGDLYYDTTSDKLRFYDGSTWNDSYLSSSGGSVTSVGVSGANGITVVSGSPVTTSGTIALSLDAPDYPTIRPSLSLNFARSGALDPRVTFTRTSSGTYYDATSKLQTAAAGTARFDHDPTTGESLGLLIEGSKTNLCLQSEDLTTTWGLVRVTATADNTTSPDGSSTADRINGTAAAWAYPSQTVSSLSTSTEYTASFFAKKGTLDYVELHIDDDNGGVATRLFNLATGASAAPLFGTAATTYAMTSVGDGWYRCSVTFTTGSASGSGNIHIRPYLSDGSTAGTSFATSDNLYLWGFQLEAGDLSSYAKTTTASVTRAADVATLTTDVSWLDAAEGTILVEGHLPTVTTANQYFLSIDNGSSEDSILIFKASSASNTTRALVIDGYTYQSDIKNGTSWADGATRQFSTVYKANDFALYESGSSVGTDTTGTLPSPTQLRIGRSHANTEHLDGHLKRIAYYPKRATNAQLAALTG